MIITNVKTFSNFNRNLCLGSEVIRKNTFYTACTVLDRDHECVAAQESALMSSALFSEYYASEEILQL
jgi:hypothetical protein